MFAVDQLAVDLDVEDSASALDQLGIDSELLLDGFRQTGGRGEVVSFDTILNGYVHRFRLLEHVYGCSTARDSSRTPGRLHVAPLSSCGGRFGFGGGSD